jgi:GT2 family glycosyltransferase
MRARNRPGITVIIPTKNRPKACRDTVTALFHQTLASSEYEIVVVDDGSNPPVRMSWPQDEPACKIVRLDGRERSAARNVGAEAATADVILFLDDDISVGSSFLETHVMAHREWERALIVGAVDLPSRTLERPFARFRQALEKQGVPRQRGITLVKNFCTAGNMSIARRQFFQLGGFDEALVSAEDQDLGLRHSEAGGAIVFLPEAVAIHRDKAMEVRSYCRRTEWGSEHLVAFCRKHPTWPDNMTREQVNGPIRWRHEPLGQSARKVARKLAACPPVLQMLFEVTAVIERVAPESLVLERLYRLLLGVHIYRGYRRGAARWAAGETPVSSAFSLKWR